MTTFWSAIVNGAVLSSLLSFAVWFALRLTPRRALNAATRYAIWWIALAITLVLPLAYVEWPSPRRATAGSEVRATRDLPWQAETTGVAARQALPLPILIPANRWLRPLLITWFATGLLLLMRVLLSYLALHGRCARAVSPPPQFDGRAERWLAHAGSARRIRLGVSNEIGIPVAAGPLRASVLIPSKLIDALSENDLDQIGLHEAAHLARRDDYALLAQRVVEAVFPLHPAVRWLTRQLDLEREIACDDVVAGSTERARSYADCLTRAVALCGGVRASLATANAADSRSHFSRRVELLLKDRGGETGLHKGRWAIIAIALISAAVLLTKTPAMVAFAAPPQPPVLMAQAPAQPEAPLDKPAPTQPLTPLQERYAQGLSQMKARQFDAAIATFQDLLGQTTDPREKADLWMHMGEAYRYKGDFAKGIALLEQAFEQLPDNAGIATNLALLYEVTKDYPHARQYYEKAIAIDPNNPLALNNLAYMLTLTNGDLDLALTYARTAQQKLPSFVEVNDTIGWIYLKKNWIDDAIGSFRLLTEQAPQNPEFHYHLGLALYQQGSLAEAMDECKMALLDKPEPDMDKDIHELIDKIAPEADAPLKKPGFGMSKAK
jgi:tetratricopeptide (TPR) repeat protein